MKVGGIMERNNSLERYLHLTMGTVSLLFLGLIYAWSIFKGPMVRVFPTLTDYQLSMTFTVSMISFCLAGFLSATIAGKVNFKVRLFTTALLLFGGFGLLSKLKPETSTNVHIKLYLFYGVLCGSGVGIGYNTLLSTVMKWFPDKAGFASGFMLMGFGFGGLILGTVASKLDQLYGINMTFFILSFAVSIGIMICTIFLKEPPEQIVQTSEHSKTDDTNEWAPNKMVKDPFFLLFTLWIILISSSGLIVINNAAGIAEFYGASTIFGLFVSVFNGIGRVFLGSTCDKVGDKKAVLINGIILTLSGLLMFSGAIMGSFPIVFIGLLCCGMSYGGAPSLSSAIIKESYGLKYYPINFSIINSQLIISAFFGPTLAGSLIELGNGSFRYAFFAICIMGILATAIGFFMFKIQLKTNTVKSVN